MVAQKAWTYSQLEGFETCPHRFYRTKVKKDIIEPIGEALTWGNSVHEALEKYISLDTPLPETMSAFQKIASKIKSLPGNKQCELKLAVDKAFQPCDYFKGAWSRGKADLVIDNGEYVSLIDWKTGKRKPSEQLQLYAGYAFAHYPKAKFVDSAFVWLKEKKIDKERYSRDDVAEIWKPLVARARKLEEAYEKEQWPQTPSGLCRGWCPVTDCSFCKRKQ